MNKLFKVIGAGLIMAFVAYVVIATTAPSYGADADPSKKNFTSLTVGNLTATNGTFQNLSVTVFTSTTGGIQSFGTITIATSTGATTTLSQVGNDFTITGSGSIVLDPATSTYINGLQVGNLNWPTDGGEVASMNMDLSSLGAGLYASQSLLGLNSTYYFKLFASSTGSGVYDPNSARVGVFPDLDWGGLNSMGGMNWYATTTQTTDATVRSISMPVYATGTVGFDCKVLARDTTTGSSSYYREQFLITRTNSSVGRQVGATTETAIEDVAAWGAAASSTATGVNLNLTGANSTNINWKAVCEMSKIEIL